MKPDNARYDFAARNPVPLNMAFFSVAKARRSGKGERTSSSPKWIYAGLDCASVVPHVWAGSLFQS
jgi:hypothetical protein